MVIDKKTIYYIQKLSKINISDNEINEMISELNDILCFVDKLSKIDTENQKILSSVLTLSNCLRDDEIKIYSQYNEILESAVESENNYFRVPKTIE